MDSTSSVMNWWTVLSLIACLNIILLLIAYGKFKKQTYGDDTRRYRRLQFIFASLYTLGCGFRSIFPRGDIRRIVLYDSWISAVAIGRTVATIAEMSFVAQWTLLLLEMGKFTRNETIRFIAKLPLPLIFIAELFSWYACITTNYIGTAIEESLWAIAASITVYGFYLARPYYEGKQKTFLNLGVFSGICYVFYMLFVDVPAYVFNWMEAEAEGKEYLSITEGFKEVCTVWHHTLSYQDWQYEMIWMTLYFSVAVWMSILIINAPRLDMLKKKS